MIVLVLFAIHIIHPIDTIEPPSLNPLLRRLILFSIEMNLMGLGLVYQCAYESCSVSNLLPQRFDKVSSILFNCLVV